MTFMHLRRRLPLDRSAVDRRMGNPLMKKTLQALVAVAVAAGTVVVASTSAWAMPCAGGERIVGKTDSAWMCQDMTTKAIRLVPFS